MLELEYIFELQKLYNPRFAESEICLPLFEQSQYNISLVSWNSPNANWLERAVIGRY